MANSVTQSLLENRLVTAFEQLHPDPGSISAESQTIINNNAAEIAKAIIDWMNSDIEIQFTQLGDKTVTAIDMVDA